MCVYFKTRKCIFFTEQTVFFLLFRPQAAVKLSQNMTNTKFTKPFLDSRISFYLTQ